MDRPAPPLSEFVEHVVTKRKGNLEYLKRTLQGKSLWLNTFQLSKADIVSFYGPQKLQKRAHRYLILGFSIAALLGLPSGAHIVQAIAQLMEEFEHFVGHPTGASKVILASNNGFKLSPVPFEPNESFKPAVQKVNKQLWYQYLQTPNICVREHLDFIEVVLSLCDCMSILYSKFLDESCSTPGWQSMVLKIDKKIKAFFFAPLCKDLTATVRPLMERQINGLLEPVLPSVGEPSRAKEVKEGTNAAPSTQEAPAISNDAAEVSSANTSIATTQDNTTHSAASQDITPSSNLASSNIAESNIAPSTLDPSNLDPSNIAPSSIEAPHELSQEEALIVPDTLGEEDPFAAIPCADGALNASDPFASPTHA